MRAGIVILPEDRWWSGEPKWQHAEELGFDHAWTYDHIGWGSLVDEPWFGAVPTLSAAAVATTRIELGTFVATPTFRDPVPFTRDVTALDDISDGRLLLGLGAGQLAPAYDVVVRGADGPTEAERAERFTEFVEVLDGLLTVDGFDYDGVYFRAVGARNRPGCVRVPRVPFAIAATGPRGMALAARLGEGWITTGAERDDDEDWWRAVAEQAAAFDRALDEAGRDPDEVLRYLSLDAGPTYSLSSVDTFAEAAQRARKLGFTDIVVHWPRSAGVYAGHETVLERVADEVLGEVKQL